MLQSSFVLLTLFTIFFETGSTAPWIPGDTSTTSQITSGMYQFNTPVIGALLPAEENSCRTPLTYARCRSFCCRSEQGDIANTSVNPGNPRLTDPFGLNSNFYMPNLNQALFVEANNLPPVEAPSISTTVSSRYKGHTKMTTVNL